MKTINKLLAISIIIYNVLLIRRRLQEPQNVFEKLQGIS